jgi:hypothetical protein
LAAATATANTAAKHMLFCLLNLNYIQQFHEIEAQIYTLALDINVKVMYFFYIYYKKEDYANYIKQENMKHILFKRAFIYKKRRNISPPENYKYDSELGAWVNKITNSLLILASDFKGQATKKLDIETGEDNKGQ